VPVVLVLQALHLTEAIHPFRLLLLRLVVAVLVVTLLTM
jgi:hypothetical protein